MPLSPAERDEVWKAVMSEGFHPDAALKAELRAAVDAVDTWIDDNATSLRASLSARLRALMSAQHLLYLFGYIVKKRLGERFRGLNLGGGK